MGSIKNLNYIYTIILIQMLILNCLFPCVNPTKYKKIKIKKRLKIPEGSVLSLAVQLSRPDILPGFYHGAIIVDAVTETPVWLELDELVKAWYNHTIVTTIVEVDESGDFVIDEEFNHEHDEHHLLSVNATDTNSTTQDTGEIPDESSRSYFPHNERCLLYEQIKIFSSATFSISKDLAHNCLLRAICEVNAISTYLPEYIQPSLTFELMHLFLSPSLSIMSEGCEDYVQAEIIGTDESHCHKYSINCPLNIGGILISNFYPELYYDHESMSGNGNK